MKYLSLIFLLTGCQTQTMPSHLQVWCRDQWKAIESASVERYGKENVKVIRMKNNVPKTHKYHMQVMVRPNGPGTTWAWIDCQPYQVRIKKNHNPACKPLTIIK